MKSLFYFGKKKEQKENFSKQQKLAASKVISSGKFQSGFEENYFLGRRLGSGTFGVYIIYAVKVHYYGTLWSVVMLFGRQHRHMPSSLAPYL